MLTIYGVLVLCLTNLQFLISFWKFQVTSGIDGVLDFQDAIIRLLMYSGGTHNITMRHFGLVCGTLVICVLNFAGAIRPANVPICVLA